MLSEIPKKEIEGYINWLEGSAAKDGTILSQQVRYLKDAFDRMYSAPVAEEASANHYGQRWDLTREINYRVRHSRAVSNV